MAAPEDTRKPDPVPTGMLTPAQAFAALREALLADVESPEEGFLTTSQWAEAGGLSICSTGKLIRAGIAAGKLEVRSYRVKVGKLVRATDHFRFKVTK